MPERIPDKLTSPTQEEMFAALGSAYVQYMGGPGTKAQICLLMAQSAFETGWWKYMHCFNIGNVKSVEGDGRDFTYFKCWEIVPTYSVAALQAHAKYGHLVSVESSDAKTGRSKIWLSPDHPGCRFRAYKSLKLGILDHFAKLIDKYTDEIPERDAWHFAVQANPTAFVHALKLKGYFTGDEAIYQRQVSSIFTMLMKKNFDMSQFQAPTKNEEDEIRNWRIIATTKGLADMLGREDESDVS